MSLRVPGIITKLDYLIGWSSAVPSLPSPQPHIIFEYPLLH